MSLYSFICDRCCEEFSDIVDYDKRDEVLCPSCGGRAKMKLDSLVTGGEVEVYDIVMPDTNKKCKRGINEALEDRWWKHKLKHDVAEHVEKHGINNAEELGLIKDNRIKHEHDD
jgi:putative FmdB family regulatory protein